jgi:tRNA pseudouridine38-40 synthase
MHRYLIQLSYNGTNFHGWQRQDNAVTVQEKIEDCITTALSTKTVIMGCGRTDTGVHAKMFFAHFDSDQELNNGLYTHKLNCMLPESIAIQSLSKVSSDFHARFSATERTYHYFLHFNKSPFRFNNSYQFKEGFLDIDRMNKAAQTLLGYQDFTSFSKGQTQVFTNNCDVKSAKWTTMDDGLKFEITANRFLRNMVRAVVGTLLQVGLKKSDIQDVRAIIESKSRSNAGYSVPASGLYLVNIEYPKELLNV